MAKLEVFGQPFSGSLGDLLISELDSGRYARLRLAVAFARNSGVLALGDAFERFRASGGRIEAFVGVDMGGTSREALRALLKLTDSLTVVHDESASVFHPKVYSLTSDAEALAVVGSANLTRGGLWGNAEASMVAGLDLSDEDDAATQGQVDTLFARLGDAGNCSARVTSVAEISALEALGYVGSEAQLGKGAAHGGPRPESALFGRSLAATAHAGSPETGGSTAGTLRVGDGTRFRTIYETCNALFGTEYKGQQKSFIEAPFRGTAYDGYAAWFPIAHVPGLTEKAERRNGWRNEYDPVAGEIRETPLGKGIEPRDPTHEPARIVFTRDVRNRELPFSFVGVFRYEGVDEAGRFVYRQVSDTFRPLPK